MPTYDPLSEYWLIQAARSYDLHPATSTFPDTLEQRLNETGAVHVQLVPPGVDISGPVSEQTGGMPPEYL